MFRATICPSSGVLVCIRIILLHMVFSTVKENCALVGGFILCCIKWVSLVIFIYDARTRIHQIWKIFLFKQPTRRSNYPNLFCYKTLHVSGIFSAHHQEFSTVHSALVNFMQVYNDRFQAESGGNCSSILTLLGSGHQKPAWNLPVPNVQ